MYDLRKHLAALAASEWNEWKASMASDVIYEEIGTHVRVKGADDYQRVVQRWKRAFPDLKATIRDLITAGDRIVGEVEWEGTHTGPLEGPSGPINPTNRRGMVRAVLVATVKQGKLVEMHHYFDQMTLLANLGLAPFGTGTTPGAKAASAPAPRHP